MFWIDFRFAVCAFPISKERFVGEEDIAFFGALRFSPSHIVADIFRFALCDGTIYSDIKFRTGISAVDALFLKIYIYAQLLEQPDIFQTVHSISCESGYGFGDDHINLVPSAGFDHFVEFITLSGACACDSLVCIDSGKLPAIFAIDAFRIIFYLHFIAVKLFFLLGGYAAVGLSSHVP